MGTPGLALLARKIEFNPSLKQMDKSRLVGVSTLSSFVSTPNYSTHKEIMSPKDYTMLSPYFGDQWVYIDAMCSNLPGVGRLLVLHAYNYAIQKKKRGVIALSFSSKKTTTPESKRVFRGLGFEVIIEQADFNTRLYGTWYKNAVTDIDLSDIAAEGISVCTRSGLTERTADTLIWRCPS